MNGAWQELTRALGDTRRIAFDLDGTLYDTRDFERPALAAVADWLRQRSGRELPGLEQALWARRESERHRPRLFDDLLIRHGLPPEWGRDCLQLFHEHPGVELQRADSLREYLLGLRANGRRLALVSNGPRDLQARKSDALGFDGAFDVCIYCGPDHPERQKPAPWAWSQLAQWRGEFSAVYVGDDPVDERFAESGGAGFVPFCFRSPKYDD